MAAAAGILVCSKCNKDKCEDEFFFKDKKNNRRHRQCKACYRNGRDSKKQYQEHKEEYKSRANKRRIRLTSENRINLINFLKGKKCNRCPENRLPCLEFHHKDRDNKRENVSRMMNTYPWSTILEEIDKCEILCANCHKIVTAKEFEYLTYSDSNKEVLILQTCWPIGTNWKRLLVFAQRL